MNIKNVKVMEVKSDYAVVLSSEGTFIRIVLKPGISVGDHIYITDADVYKAEELSISKHTLFSKRAFFSKRTAMTFARMALVSSVVLVFMLFKALSPVAYAVLSVDINPSFQMVVDAAYNVLDVEGKNDEARQLLTEVEWKKGQSATAVLQRILEEVSDNGYIHDGDNHILVAAALIDSKKKDIEPVNQMVESILDQLDYQPFTEGKLIISAISSDHTAIEQSLSQVISIGTYELEKRIAPVEPYIEVNHGQAKKLMPHPIKPNKQNQPEEEVETSPSTADGTDTEKTTEVTTSKPEKPSKSPATEEKTNNGNGVPHPSNNNGNNSNNSNNSNNGNGGNGSNGKPNVKPTEPPVVTDVSTEMTDATESTESTVDGSTEAGTENVTTNENKGPSDNANENATNKDLNKDKVKP